MGMTFEERFEMKQRQIRQFLSAEMLRRGWKQRDLAMHSGLPVSYISRILSGKVNLTLETIVKLEAAVGEDIVKVAEHPNASWEFGREWSILSSMQPVAAPNFLPTDWSKIWSEATLEPQVELNVNIHEPYNTRLNTPTYFFNDQIASMPINRLAGASDHDSLRSVNNMGVFQSPDALTSWASIQQNIKGPFQSYIESKVSKLSRFPFDSLSEEDGE
jgi:transcriptional regulator with XRE-family HTH domain